MGISVWFTNQGLFGGKGVLQFGYLRKLFKIESSEVKYKCAEKMLNCDVLRSQGCTEQV
jgi:hypothetical protein